MKTQETVIPHLGQLLRALIKAGGYRSFLVEIGQDKNLDDLAGVAKDRQSSAFEVMQSIEDSCNKAVAKDCGHEWAQIFRQIWFRTRECIQVLVQQVDVSPLSLDTGQELFRQQFTIPMLSDFMHLIVSLRNGGDAEAWLSKPLHAWLALASSRSGIAESELLISLANELHADQRTIDRWLSGESIGKLSWPYATRVATVLGKKQVDSEVQLLSGWLLVGCALQSLSPASRGEVRRNYIHRKQQPWNFKKSMDVMNSAGLKPEGWPAPESVIPLLQRIEHIFREKSLKESALQGALNEFQRLIVQAPASFQRSYQPICDWFTARLAAIIEDKETALRLYANAVTGAWWRSGKNQYPILKEALIYAVGVGEKDAANAYWDKTFMLGLNRGPKRPLDEQEMRRIAFAFEQHFPQQKAKDRIPPPVEFRSHDDAFSLSRKHLSNPNQKTKYAKGRTRRTPLMVAIQDGTLDEVKQLISVGGDPNDFIPESGEGPLSYAMRRACDRKDSIIMNYILSLKLTPETVNRPASTKRETPLKIAIEMANASVVSQLIELGADVESACNFMPSALCYAMQMFYMSLHRDDSSQIEGYFAGKSPVDVYDAKEGAVLDADLAARRQRLLRRLNSSERNSSIFKEVLDYFIRPPELYRKVIQVLMSGGADANRRYRVEVHDQAEWTPTLFAAQVGDLVVFKMLVEHKSEKRGDPKLTLVPSGSLECFDALWVAIDHGRNSIASYLIDRECLGTTNTVSG